MIALILTKIHYSTGNYIGLSKIQLQCNHQKLIWKPKLIIDHHKSTAAVWLPCNQMRPHSFSDRWRLWKLQRFRYGYSNHEVVVAKDPLDVSLDIVLDLLYSNLHRRNKSKCSFLQELSPSNQGWDTVKYSDALHIHLLV